MTQESESLRQLHLAAVQDDLAANTPGSFGCHELLDRTHLLSEQIEAQLASHPACLQHPEWFALAQQAMTALHQAIGAEHLATNSFEQCSPKPE
jgi:hypothetical protein